MSRPPVSADQRFWSKVQKTESCWIWTANKGAWGHGQFWDGKRVTQAYRFAYESVKSKIPEGLTIDHLCRNPPCVNPDHLEIVTQGENVLRGIGITAQEARQTHCKRGHPFDESNSRIYHHPDGRAYRKCITCQTMFDEVRNSIVAVTKYDMTERIRDIIDEVRKRE